MANPFVHGKHATLFTSCASADKRNFHFQFQLYDALYEPSKRALVYILLLYTYRNDKICMGFSGLYDGRIFLDIIRWLSAILANAGWRVSESAHTHRLNLAIHAHSRAAKLTTNNFRKANKRDTIKTNENFHVYLYQSELYLPTHKHIHTRARTHSKNDRHHCVFVMLVLKTEKVYEILMTISNPNP